MSKKIVILFFLFLSGFATTLAQRTELNHKDTMQVQWIKGSKFYLYKVEKGETIYSITKRFSVTEEVLNRYNPELKDGLKTKMQLLIPAPSAYKKAENERPEEKKISKRDIHVGLMLPINIWKCMLPDSLYEDSTQKGFDEESIAQLEFYEGALHAAELLATADFRIHLRLFDTENDSTRVSELLKGSRTKDLDFILATGNQAVLKRLNQFSLTNKIPLLTPALNSSDLFRNNMNAWALSPSSVTQCYEAGKICSGKFKNSNAIVVKSGAGKENDRSIAFINGWNDHADVKCRSIDYSKGEFKFLLSSLSKGANNLLFIPSSNEDFVNSIITGLNDTTDVYRITIIGIPTWQYFGSNDPAALENLHTNLFMSSHLDYEDSTTQSFRKFFRNEYLAEPSETAYQGYDAMMLIGKSGNHDVSGKLNDLTGLFSTYRFRQVNGMNENQYIRLVKYEGYKLVEVK